MENAQLLDDVEGVVRPLVESEDVELVELVLGGGRGRRFVRVFVDRPGGITVDECARLNRLIGAALDAEDPTEGSCVLEASSPGLDRLLKTERDFSRSSGRKVRVILSSGATYVGVLKACLGESIILDLPDGPMQLDRESIAKANLEVDL